MQYSNMRLRHELKYYIPYPEYKGLRNRLAQVLERDKHSVNEEGYHIRSLYFDDVYDSALFHKNSGVSKRYKYRIRIYNLSDSLIVLERKSKFNEYICKESALLSREAYESVIRGELGVLAASSDPVITDFYIECRLHDLKPIVVVDYVREAYVHELGEVRVTFDKELAANVKDMDIFDPRLITVEAVREPIMIMEVKYNDYLPGYVGDMLQLSAYNRSAISKYVLCREQSMKHYNL
ncbi:VTC domain protein [compost metagenome]